MNPAGLPLKQAVPKSQVWLCGFDPTETFSRVGLQLITGHLWIAEKGTEMKVGRHGKWKS